MVKPYRQAKAGSFITISVAGVADLKERLEKFGKKIQRKAVRECFKAMAKPIIETVSAMAPKDIGLLKKSITWKVIARSKRTGQATLRIGPRNKRTKVIKRMYSKTIKLTKVSKRNLEAGKIKGKVAFANPSKYSHLVHGGTGRGVRGTNYMALGLARSRDKAVMMFNREMATQVLIAGVEAKKA